MLLRYALALAVAGLLGTAALAQTYRATAPTPAHDHDHAHGTYEVVGTGDGGVVCRPADAAALAQLRRASGQPLRLTVVPSTNDPATLDGMRILLRATDQLLERPQALLAFRRAAALWERRVTTPITVVIDVDFGPERFDAGPYPPGVIASATAALDVVSLGDGSLLDPAGLRQTLLDATDDAQLEQLYAAIPDPVPSTSGAPLRTALLALPNRQALGFAPADTDPDPTINPFGDVANIGFNSAFSYDFNPANGISPGATDFEAVVAHEIGHSLGFNSVIGFGGPPNNFFTTWDLFRVRPEAVEPGDYASFSTAARVVTPGPPPSDTLVVEGGTVYFEPEQVFFDGLAEIPTSTATGGREGGDGQQASHWQDDGQRPPSLGDDRRIGIMDPTIARGDRILIEAPDVRVLQVLGYDVEYDPPTTALAVRFDGEPLDLTSVADPITLGDTPVGETGEARLVLANEGAAALVYEAELFATYAVPEEAIPTLSVSEQGEVPPGAEGDLVVSFGSASAGTFGGLLRLRTNAQNRLVIDIPFEYTTGGASRPTIALDDDLLNFETLSTDQGAVTQTVTITNGGALPLTYEARMALAVRGGAARSPLAQFVGGPRAARAQTLFQAAFEDDFGGFTAGGAFPGDWRRVDVGAANLSGHSEPFAAYFGRIFPEGFEGPGEPDSLRYRNNATGLLLSPPIDLSGVPPGDLVTLAFTYYLQAEAGADIASVVISYDDGETFTEVASSDGGLLTNTDAWQAVLVPLPGVSGAPDPIRFGFRFVSDFTGIDEGWYLDDVELAALPGANPFYTTPRAGTVLQDAPAPLDVTVQPALLEPAIYRGSVTLLTNDLFQPEVTILVGFTLTDPVASEDETAPARFALHASYPNPFHERATLRFDLPRAAEATLTVYDVLGREVARLLDAAPLTAGRHTATLEARGLAAGAYLVRLDVGDDSDTQRLLLVR